MTDISSTIRTAFSECSSATLSTLLVKRGLRNTAVRGVRPLRPGMPPMVGPAFTLRYIPAREDIDAYGSGGDPANLQRQAIEIAPDGHVFVIDCRGDADIAGIGSILVRRLQGRGLCGVVLDGGVRDTTAIAGFDIAVYCVGAAVPPNYAGHHAAEINGAISCGGVAVYPGDIVFGDSEAVIIVPRQLAEEVATEGAAMERRERFLVTEIEAGRSIVGVYPPDAATIARYEAWSAANP
ncbi:MAG: ribonuclease activity regulator RraA [Hyphomicrobiales bacterium]|nr:MAG: ribonuclease activity regulator RraA [Hyphomicrobiales bacterium]